MIERLRWGAAMLVFAAGCGGSAATGAAPDGGGAPEGGTSCADMYHPLSELTALFSGSWLIDDAATNEACPNALEVTLGPNMTHAAPPDPDAQRACPPPSVFFGITPGDVKGCDTTAYCPTVTGGYGFFIHAIPKNTTVMPTVFTELLWLNSNGTWTQTGLNGMSIGVAASGDTLTLNDRTFKPTNVGPGKCQVSP